MIAQDDNNYNANNLRKNTSVWQMLEAQGKYFVACGIAHLTEAEQKALSTVANAYDWVGLAICMK